MEQRETTISDGQHAKGGSASALRVMQAGFEQRLKQNGVLDALAFLNVRTRFRFTGLYLVDLPSLHNVALFDRENPTLNVSGAVCALEDSYCSLVCNWDRPFAIDDARNDARVAQHPRRESIQSYAGVPVRRPDGSVQGTLCHFDGRPRLLPAGELPVLEALAPLLIGWLAPSGDA